MYIIDTPSSVQLTYEMRSRLSAAGCVWVYRIYEPVMDPALSGDPHYCNATVYVFAFWFITTAYIFLGLVTSCICCISIYAQTRTEREQ